MESDEKPLVYTIHERCRICYTCVRECPAKAIRIEGGQAQIVTSRCIGCGNCVRVCSQGAKQVESSIEDVEQLLVSGQRLLACLAPSFPAEFPELDTEVLVGAVRSLGFERVCEVAFGADLVAAEYRKLVEEQAAKNFIASTCPAVCTYVCRYHPDSVPNLAPVVSPMIATARVLRRIYGADSVVVFIGPCVAKMGEAREREEQGLGSQGERPDIDAVLTFAELRALLRERDVIPEEIQRSDFDPPWGGLGALFAVSHGLIEAAGIEEDLMVGQVITTDGRQHFTEGIKEFDSGDLDVTLLDVLCCSGCIMGPGMTGHAPLYRRLANVVQRTRSSLSRRKMLDQGGIDAGIDPRRIEGLNLRRTFVPSDHRLPAPVNKDIEPILARMGKNRPEDELNCGACGYPTCREHALAIHEGLAESEMCLPYTIEPLRDAVAELARSNGELASTQQALMHSEKLASMGQLAAGIAHEVNNPLGVVLIYAHLLQEQVASGSTLSDDIRMIAEQAERCKKIVSGLLNFARQNKGTLEPTDMAELAERAMKVLVPPPGVQVHLRQEGSDAVAEVDGDQITQVLTNLVSNAYAAMPEGGELEVLTRGEPERVALVVKDTGTGIKKEHFKKLYEPFFTTKPPGKGTGLGLAVTYGIVKMHRGDIRVVSNARPEDGPLGTTFTVTLPRRADPRQLNPQELQAGLRLSDPKSS